MKHILITGADSYIGMSFASYCAQHYPDAYSIDTVDMRDPSWESKDFSSYDAVFHVAGIAHILTSKPTAEQERLYKEVNTDLTFRTAQKAKADGVRQFVFMSTMAVYGDGAPIGCDKVICFDTVPMPTGFYGSSKLQAEKDLETLTEDGFRIALVRAPMVYGCGCRGNYPTLAKIAKKMSVFPKINNRRSMLYIDNLCEFIHLIIDREERGLFWPQNDTYTNTSNMVVAIAAEHGKRVRLLRGATPLLRLIGFFSRRVNKAFGNFVYDMAMSSYDVSYNVCSYEESISRTESNPSRTAAEVPCE